MNILRSNRPWGHFEQLTLNQESTVKILHVSQGKRLSKQYHLRRTEFWKILKGRVLIELGNDVFILSAGESIKITKGTVHRIEALENTMVLEISTGFFDEADITRIEDDYGRESDKAASGDGNTLLYG